MTTAPAIPLTKLYEADETAWLDSMAVLTAQLRFSKFNLHNPQGHIVSMAVRERRETTNRLRVLIANLWTLDQILADDDA